MFAFLAHQTVLRVLSLQARAQPVRRHLCLVPAGVSAVVLRRLCKVHAQFYSIARRAISTLETTHVCLVLQTALVALHSLASALSVQLDSL